MYFALELGNEGKSGFGLLHSRLQVITYEDIGLADPSIVSSVSQALLDMKTMYQNKKEIGRWYFRILCSYFADHKITDYRSFQNNYET